MTSRHSTHTRRGRRQRGFTLLNVLVAAALFGVGMLGIARAFVGITSAATQNENVSALGALSNSFWTAMDANSSSVIGAFAGFSGPVTYTSANYTTAPAAIQPWLQQFLATLPGGSATVAPGPDSASGAACSVAGGCTVTLTVQWPQPGAPGSGSAVNRSQVFLYRISQ